MQEVGSAAGDLPGLVTGTDEPLSGPLSGQSLLEAIRRYVLEDQRSSATPLSEALLAKQFQVSRTPIREALKQLQVEGLVEIRPRVGTFIREPSPRELAELYDVKEVLEGLAARLLAARGRVNQVDLLEENVDRSRAAVHAGDHQGYAALVLEFHTLLISGADTVKLSDHYRLLMNQLAYHRLVLRTLRPERMTVSLQEHERVLARVLAKDQFGAELAMREHVQASSREAMANRM
jgi:DNA-binding GntR family transcriptional regulator